jgi:hypothetical protein
VTIGLKKNLSFFEKNCETFFFFDMSTQEGGMGIRTSEKKKEYKKSLNLKKPKNNTGRFYGLSSF